MGPGLNHLFPFMKGQVPKELKINQAQGKYIHFPIVYFLVLLQNTIKGKKSIRV